MTNATHESKHSFVSRIEFIRSKLSEFSAQVAEVSGDPLGPCFTRADRTAGIRPPRRPPPHAGPRVLLERRRSLFLAPRQYRSGESLEDLKGRSWPVVSSTGNKVYVVSTLQDLHH